MAVYQDYQWESGEDYRGLAPLDAAIPGMVSQPLDSHGVGIGSHSAEQSPALSPEGNGGIQPNPQGDAMSGLDSDASDMFNDVPLHSVEIGGMDSMSGVSDESHIAELANEQMHIIPEQH